jgi:hypothetical protein
VTRKQELQRCAQLCAGIFLVGELTTVAYAVARVVIVRATNPGMLAGGGVSDAAAGDPGVVKTPDPEVVGQYAQPGGDGFFTPDRSGFWLRLGRISGERDPWCRGLGLSAFMGQGDGHCRVPGCTEPAHRSEGRVDFGTYFCTEHCPAADE